MARPWIAILSHLFFRYTYIINHFESFLTRNRIDNIFRTRCIGFPDVCVSGFFLGKKKRPHIILFNQSLRTRGDIRGRTIYSFNHTPNVCFHIFFSSFFFPCYWIAFFLCFAINVRKLTAVIRTGIHKSIAIFSSYFKIFYIKKREKILIFTISY